MVRLADFDDTVNNGQAGFSAFFKQNKRVFARAYQRKAVEIGYDEAVKRISQIEDADVRDLSMDCIYSGLRSAEALNRRGEASISGKGGIRRDLFIRKDTRRIEGVTYSRLYRGLKSVGLKPHDLRKLAATNFVRAGMREHDLLKVMGWTSMQTAALYLQPMDNEALAKKVKEAFENARS